MLSTQRKPQISNTQVQNLPLPPVHLELSNLSVMGKVVDDSLCIIRSSEQFELSLEIKFRGGSLTDFLLCAGLEIDVTYTIEGFGPASKTNIDAMSVKTIKGKYEYVALYSGTPAGAGLVPGFYKVAALVTVKCPDACCNEPVAFGYITPIVFQVYA
ncbi:hypothetical protein IQ249_10455 [Lusitaniella coriacea LEGE 07157]|uniref:Uncharacterized protein n=1 Tax=Lusitaniella coriacea LEGE 07157 TaxID=945747 RepID=A0A8J7DWG8_9CYAN|nr:hypothetical protein [Lusitaniella coriacea]MBE9116318.1 hypothetical protein [Lusitaniella coriacea LEGE 07157]